MNDYDDLLSPALHRLQSAVDDLATATARAEQIEFPDVDLTTTDQATAADRDLPGWIQDDAARDAEFQRRVAAAIDDAADRNRPFLSAEQRDAIVAAVRDDMNREEVTARGQNDH